MKPVGYVLKWHIFKVAAAADNNDDNGTFRARATEDGADCGVLIFFGPFPYDTKVTITTNEIAIQTQC